MRLVVAAACLGAALAGCGEAPSDDAPAMAMEAETKSAKGTGTVVALDTDAGTVTLDHAPMPDLGWPAMMMAFKADPALLEGFNAGDQVVFDVTLADGRGEITALSKRAR